MSALAERTIEVMPLGRRGRYSLTPQLQRVYLAMVRLFDASEKAPTLDEIAHASGLAGRGSVGQHIYDLEERGWIDRHAHKARGITLTEPVLRHLTTAA
jgi:SOS-response transcriptional repressor LexA